MIQITQNSHNCAETLSTTAALASIDYNWLKVPAHQSRGLVACSGTLWLEFSFRALQPSGAGWHGRRSCKPRGPIKGEPSIPGQEWLQKHGGIVSAVNPANWVRRLRYPNHLLLAVPWPVFIRLACLRLPAPQPACRGSLCTRSPGNRTGGWNRYQLWGSFSSASIPWARSARGHCFRQAFTAICSSPPSPCWGCS